jgi:polar amino acid transport system ATP-binding protein
MLRAIHIRKSISGRKILGSVDLDISSGKVSALLGRNGAGKSTVLKCLSLVEFPDEGHIDIDGDTYVFPTPHTIVSPWPRVTALFQGLHLWPHMRVRENIFGPLQWQAREYDRAFAKRLLDDFELNDVMDRYPAECSGGQRQRAAVARSLILPCQYLLLDEPTASADVEHAHILGTYIRELATRGVGILVVTHMFGFARSIADRIVFMEGGAIVEEGDATLLTAPRSESLRRLVSLH